MQLFYSTQIVEGHLLFDDEEMRHILKSLRMKMGDQVTVLDGKGNVYQSILTHLKPLKARIISRQFVQPQECNLHIAIAPTKNLSRWEWFLEKGTELGISRITPLQCHQSERVRIKTDRADRILRSALKQSGRAHLPCLEPLKSFAEVVSNAGPKGQRLIAHCHDETPVIEKADMDQSQITVLIGPEGDFTRDEIELAESAGFKAISLGNHRLRTETAGVYICSLVKWMHS